MDRIGTYSRFSLSGIRLLISVVALLVAAPIWAQDTAADTGLIITLINVDQYQDVRHLTEIVKKDPGVSAILPREETNGFIQLGVEAAPGIQETLAQSLREQMGPEWDVQLKSLPANSWEIQVSKKNS